MINQIIKRFGLTFAVCCLSPAVMAGPIFDGVEWRQLTQTTNFSYNQIKADTSNGCSASSGICSGVLGSVSVGGWTWASVADVSSLFATMIGAAWDDSIALQTLEEAGSTWAGDIIRNPLVSGDTGFFDATYFTAGIVALYGITRTGVGTQLARSAGVEDSTSTTQVDKASTEFGLGSNNRSPYFGIWLYREADVPEPDGWFLISLGLLLLFLTKLYRTRRLTCQQTMH